MWRTAGWAPSQAVCKFKLTRFLAGRVKLELLTKQKNPRILSEPGVHQLWQCPTLAQPLDALPSGLQRFTSVFGMGTGGATALGSPEGW
jgi:hypothetical protein